MNPDEKKELCDNTARALGWVDFPSDSGGGDQFWFKDAAKAPFCERLRKVDWNPIDHNDDAYFLVIKLKLSIHSSDLVSICEGRHSISVAHSDLNGDPFASMRLAISYAASLERP